MAALVAKTMKQKMVRTGLDEKWLITQEWAHQDSEGRPGSFGQKEGVLGPG